MAQRLVLAVYDGQDAGSRGLLWKAVNGENTLYLLGTIHMDRNNVYPFHKSLRDAISASDTVIFEVSIRRTTAWRTTSAQTSTGTPWRPSSPWAWTRRPLAAISPGP